MVNFASPLTDAEVAFSRLRAVTQHIPMKTGTLVHSELSRTIIGSAITVLNTLKPGLSEKAYENALAIELRHQGLEVQQQRRYDVYYRNQQVDILIPDLLVNDLVIVDPKVVEEFNPAHLAQMTSYLAITSLKLALLLNFKHGDLRWKRVVREFYPSA